MLDWIRKTLPGGRFKWEGHNGKSTVCDVLTALLGHTNISSLTLEQIIGRFDLACTLGKLANIAADIGEVAKVDEGCLKSFIGGDMLKFEKKFKTPLWHDLRRV